jgi:hypothetical protein
MIRISVTQAAYRAIRASLPPEAIISPDFDPEAPTVPFWLDRKIADGLSAMRQPDESLSDVIFRVARLERRALEPDQIEELERILLEDGPALPRAPQPKDHSRRKLTPKRRLRAQPDPNIALTLLNDDSLHI